MKSKIIFGALALVVAVLGFAGVASAASSIGFNQGAGTKVGNGWGNVAEAKNLPKHTSNGNGAFTNMFVGTDWNIVLRIADNKDWTIVAEGNVPEGSFPLFVQEGNGKNTNIYKFNVEVKDGLVSPLVLGSGVGSDSVNEVRWGSFTPDEGTVIVPVDNCDTSRVVGGVAGWLEKNNINGADCFDYAVKQTCGSLSVSITRQPEPKYVAPFRAVYVIGDKVASGYKNFPVTFAEDYNGGSVDVTWFTVGPEKDWLKGFDFPNLWGEIGQTITVDTDCEGESTPAVIKAAVKCATHQDQAKIELTLTNSGETAGEVSVNGEIVNVPAKSSIVSYFDSKTSVKVVDGEEVILDQTLDCTPGQGGGGTTPETPKTPEAPESPKSPESPIVLPNTFGASTPLVAAGALSFASLILVAGTAIKSRLLA